MARQRWTDALRSAKWDRPLHAHLLHILRTSRRKRRTREYRIFVSYSFWVFRIFICFHVTRGSTTCAVATGLRVEVLPDLNRSTGPEPPLSKRRSEGAVAWGTYIFHRPLFTVIWEINNEKILRPIYCIQWHESKLVFPRSTRDVKVVNHILILFGEEVFYNEQNHIIVQLKHHI